MITEEMVTRAAQRLAGAEPDEYVGNAWMRNAREVLEAAFPTVQTAEELAALHPGTLLSIKDNSGVATKVGLGLDLNGERYLLAEAAKTLGPFTVLWVNPYYLSIKAPL